jgi:hypothetical protein
MQGITIYSDHTSGSSQTSMAIIPAGIIWMARGALNDLVLASFPVAIVIPALRIIRNIDHQVQEERTA